MTERVQAIIFDQILRLFIRIIKNYKKCNIFKINEKQYNIQFCHTSESSDTGNNKLKIISISYDFYYSDYILFNLFHFVLIMPQVLCPLTNQIP